MTNAVLEVFIHDNRPLNHVGLGTLHVPWVEGAGRGRDDDFDHGGACFMGPSGPHSRWRDGLEEGDFNSVDAGNGGNATAVTRARSLGEGWWAIDVDPYIIHAAREHGQTIILTDETGIQDGHLTNAFIASRPSGANAPRLKVTWESRVDTVAPEFKEPLVVESGPITGSLLIRLPAAGDDGLEGDALGYRVRVGGRDLPRKDIPRPHRLQRTILVRDLPPGQEAEVVVTAFDKGGNTAETRATGTSGVFTRRLAQPQDLRSVSLPAARSARRFVARLADGLTLFDPLTGGLSPKQFRADADAPSSARVFPAVRGEILGFQTLIQLADGLGKLDGISVAAGDLVGPGGAMIPAANFEFHRQHYVKMGDQWIADILPTLAPGQTISVPSQSGMEGQVMAAVYVDLLVDKSTAPGVYSGEVVVSAGGERSTCPIAVVVRDVTIPDELGFIVELNNYGHSRDAKVFHETFRIGHKHRLSYNVIIYGHSWPGTIPALNLDQDPDLPGREAKVADWSEYDRLYGPLFSGELTHDLPRRGEPASHWYLPFHVSWPYRIQRVHPHLWEGRTAPNVDKAAFAEWVNRLAVQDPLVEEHFNDDYREAVAAIGRQFREHFARNGWTKTAMQLLDNNKYYFETGSQSLWTLDEPQYGRDFRALELVYHFAHEGMKGEGINSVIRSDLSRPQLMGDRMDRVIDLIVTTGMVMELHPRLMEDLVICKNADLWWYGAGDTADVDPASYVALFLARWNRGCNGGIPAWTSFGGSNDWDKTHPLRVVRYDPRTNMPVASFRMKAYRRAQQDMELLTMLSRKDGFSRWHLRDLAEELFPIRTITVSPHPDDPGYTTYEGLNVARIDLLRERAIATLLEP